jgi:hypothetical protein
MINCPALNSSNAAGCMMSWLLSRLAKRFTDRAMARDPWRSVYSDLGKRPKARALRDAHFWAERCYEAAAYRAANPLWRGMRAFEPRPVECGRAATPGQHAEAACKRLEILEAIDPALRRRCLSAKYSADGTRQRIF